jgi:HlyD family secretion protein
MSVMKKKKKILIIAGAAVVLAIIVVANLLSSRETVTDVQAEKVHRRDLVEQVSASGRVQPSTKVDITAEVTGEIRALFVREGDPVRIGDPLLVLDTVQLRSDVDQARYMLSEVNSRLSGSKASLAQAQDDYDRQKKLFESGLCSEDEHNRTLYALQNAQANVNALEAQSKQTQSRLDKQIDYLKKAKIVAPMAGVITYLDCEVGEIAPAQTGYSQGKVLMTISNLEQFEVEVEVDETEINKVELGQVVDIEVDAFVDTSFSGQVVEIGNTAIQSGMGSESQSTDFRVKVVFTDPAVKLRPGMSATVDVTTATGAEVLAIPYSAVVMRSFDLDSLARAREADSAGTSDSQGGVQAAEVDSSDDTISEEKERPEIKGVFVVRGDVARFVQIETGIADKKRIQVVTGLADTDSVISGPYRVLRSIKDGDKVNITRVGEKGEEPEENK